MRFRQDPFTCQWERENTKAEGVQISHFYGSFSSDILAVKGLTKSAGERRISLCGKGDQQHQQSEQTSWLFTVIITSQSVQHHGEISHREEATNSTAAVTIPSQGFNTTERSVTGEMQLTPRLLLQSRHKGSTPPSDQPSIASQGVQNHGEISRREEATNPATAAPLPPPLLLRHKVFNTTGRSVTGKRQPTRPRLLINRVTMCSTSLRDQSQERRS